MTISYTHEVPMGHRLQNHEGKCRYLHGHNYLITTHVVGELDKNGMVMDFKRLKTAVLEVLSAYDHAFVLEDTDPAQETVREFSRMVVFPFPPTAEHMAKQWKSQISEELQLPEELIHLSVWETRDCCAETS